MSRTYRVNPSDPNRNRGLTMRIERREQRQAKEAARATAARAASFPLDQRFGQTF